jgi:hypothetical protein
MDQALLVGAFGGGAYISTSGRVSRKRALAAGIAGISSFFYLGSRLEYLNLLREGRARRLSPGNLCYLLGSASLGALCSLSLQGVIGALPKKPSFPLTARSLFLAQQ